MAFPKADRQAAVRDLKSVHAARGHVPAALVRDIAESIGCTERTVWSWWAAHRDAAGVEREPQPAPGLSEEQVEVIFATCGNVSAAHRDLLADEEAAATTPSRRTLARWWQEQDAAVRAFAVDGASGLMNQQMRVRHTVDSRNQLWRMDHQQFPVWVLPAAGSKSPVKPWITTIIDDYSRYLLSVLVTVESADATSVVVSIADAMRMKPTDRGGVQVGGVPLAIGHDNGGELRSDQVQSMLRRLGVASKRTYPYMKHLNGKAERVQQTMQEDLARVLPGYADGPKTLKLRDLYGLDTDLLTEQLLSEMLHDWVYRYNSERPHQALEGRTPLEVWAEDRTPLQVPDMDAVRLAMMLEDRPRKVTAEGVSFRGKLYTSGELAALRIVGQKVTVRYFPHDDTFIELFDGYRWLCTAVPSHTLDEGGRKLLQQVNREQYQRARAYAEQARERRRLSVIDATLQEPGRAPLSTSGMDLVTGGEEALLRLTAPDEQTPTTFDVEEFEELEEVEEVASEVVHVGAGDDPWELPGTAGSGASGGSDREGQ